ncbi:phosphorylase b kinase gamma catalytic chain, skeletal muscle/heart isoform-like [Bolinopsis microptera]|uniref:phosphorylase b kinase gamma catalytic chain, skeletal muscle/heart isoform-like n=1 Tax=Bolinopsis microptera TaxID=2820187 RepID=UPI003079744F
MIKSGLAEKLKSLSGKVLFDTRDEHDIDSFHAQYEVKEELGRGLTSIVCKCVDRFTDEKYAVKIIDLNQSCDLDVEDSIVSEVSALSRLPQHPNVTALIKVYSTNANVYIVLELAPNGELFDYVNQFAVLSEKVAANLFRQLLLGLHHLHFHDIVHRDIKMENVLMNEKLGIKLTDFGFAKRLEPGEALHDLCGTLSYISPEMIRSELGSNLAGYGKEVDMWACGVLLYTLLMGQPPFHHPIKLSLMRQIQECRYDRKSDTWLRLSDSVRGLIGGLLQVDVKKRITAEQALQHPWIKHDDFRDVKRHTTGKRKFRQVVYLALFVVTIRSRARATLISSNDGNQLQLIREHNATPYHIKEVRAVMDDIAFTIYGHWVQREDPTRRAMMFRHRRRNRSHSRTFSLNE